MKSIQPYSFTKFYVPAVVFCLTEKSLKNNFDMVRKQSTVDTNKQQCC